MTEEQIQQEESTIVPTFNDQLQQAVWSGQPIQEEQVQPAAATEEVKPTEEPKKEGQDELLDPSEWVKREFEVESPDVLKQYIKEYKELKEKQPTSEEVKFANDQSKLLYEYLKEGKEDEAFHILSQKKQIEKLTSGEVTEDNAADIIKLSIKNKYKEFSDSDVERKFSKQYGIPKEPVYDENKETEDEFTARHTEWQEKVKDIKADMILDAKVAKPELEQLKSQLVLPDISKKEGATKQQPSQEELAAFEKQVQSFLKTTETSLNEFNGFITNVKDKDVDYSVSYTPSKEEKDLVSSKLKEFADAGFDANAILAQRWVNEDKSLNVSQMVKDLSKIYGDDKVFQKIANDAANQRLELYLKEKKNIKIDGTANGEFKADEKQEVQKLQEFFWGN